MKKIIFVLCLLLVTSGWSQDSGGKKKERELIQNQKSNSQWIAPSSIHNKENIENILISSKIPEILSLNAYNQAETIGLIMELSGLKIVDYTNGVWLQKSEEKGSLLALEVEPLPQFSLDGRGILMIMTLNGIHYPLLVDPGFDRTGIRLQALGTLEAVQIELSQGDLHITPSNAFSPGLPYMYPSLQMYTNDNRLIAISLSGTTDCIWSALTANFNWSKVLCAMLDYTVCVITSASVGVVGCLVVFKQLLPDPCAGALDLASCFSGDRTNPGLTIIKPSSTTVSGTSVQIQVLPQATVVA